MKVVDIAVDLVDWMGSDLDVAGAARVSFSKESSWDHAEDPAFSELSEEELLAGGFYLLTQRDYDGYVKLKDQDAKLIRYLAKHNHWSPFSHCYLKFRIKAPLFCAAQLKKHTVGLAWNEVSRRYVDTAPEFYMPPVYHAQPENKKQGSGKAHSNQYPAYNNITPRSIMFDAYDLYMDMIAQGYAPEEARMILPQNMMTEWIWSGSLYAFARVVNLRTAPDAQKAATQEVANKIAQFVKQHFPVSCKELCSEPDVQS